MAGNIAKYVCLVNNIPWTISRQQLALYFSQFGYVHNSIIIFDKNTGISKNYGFVTFTKKEHVDSALTHKHTLEGNNLSLTLMKKNNLNNNNGTFN